MARPSTKITGTVRRPPAASMSAMRASWSPVTSILSNGIPSFTSNASARRQEPQLVVPYSRTRAPPSATSLSATSLTAVGCGSALVGFAVVGEILEDDFVQALVGHEIAGEGFRCRGRLRVPGHADLTRGADHPTPLCADGLDGRLRHRRDPDWPRRLPGHADVARRGERLRLIFRTLRRCTGAVARDVTRRAVANGVVTARARTRRPGGRRRRRARDRPVDGRLAGPDIDDHVAPDDHAVG